MKKKSFQSTSLLGLCLLAASMTGTSVLADAVQVTGAVTVKDSATNASYLNQNIEITAAGSLTYSNYKPCQTQAITITNNGKLTFNLTGNQTLVTASAGTITFNGSGKFIKSGNAALYSLNGDFKVKYAFSSGAQFNVEAGTFFNGKWLQQNWRENKSDMTISSGATLNLWDGGYADAEGAYTVKTGVIIDALNGAGTITATAGGAPGLFVMGVDDGNGTFSGRILGKADGASINTISIEKKGTGTQILTGKNTYTGTTKISAGTLQIGNATASGTLGTGAVTVASGAKLAFNRKDGQTITNAVSGTGTIAVNSGSISLTNAFTGAVEVAAGAALGVASKANLQSGTFKIADGGALALNVDGGWTKDEFLALRASATPFADSSNVTWAAGSLVGIDVSAGKSVDASGMFAVAKPLFKTGEGELLISSDQTGMTVPLTVTQGTLRLTNSGKFTGAANVLSGADFVFDLGTGNTRVLDQAISGEGNLIVKSGTLQVTSASPTITYTYPAGTGTLTVNAKIDAASVTINDGAKLYFADKIVPHNDRNVTFRIDAGGTLEFNNTNSSVTHGTDNSITQEAYLKISDAEKYTAGGNTTITGGGTLLKTGAGAIAALINNNGTRKFTVAMDAGGLIDVQGGTFVNGGWPQQEWGSNKASLNLAAGTTLNLWDGAGMTVDALTGSGSIMRGKTRTFTVGAGNHTVGAYNEAGTATFSGKFGNGEVTADPKVGLSLRKVGSGTQIMAGANNYDGTTVSAGTLQFNANSNLGTGILKVDGGATLNLANGLTNTIGGAFSGSGTVNLTAGSKLASSTFNDFRGTIHTADGTNATFPVADGATQILNASVTGTGTFTKTGSGTLQMNGKVATTGLATYDGGGKIILSHGGEMGSNIAINSSTTAEFAQSNPYAITLYSLGSGDGRVLPTASTVGTFQKTAMTMDDCINNTDRGIITTYSTVSYQTEIWVPNDVVLDFAGVFDDTVGVFLQKINEDGTTGSWETVMGYGSNCAAVTKSAYTLKAGHYLADFRAVDQSGEAHANAGFSTAADKRLGIGVRKTDSATSSQTNNYFALDVDSNGNIAFGDGSILTINPNKEFAVENAAIADGAVFTINNPSSQTKSLAVSGNFTGADGTLKITNTSGTPMDLTLSGQTEGNLELGSGMTVHLSKENVFDVAGTFTQAAATTYVVDLDGITEDTSWFGSVTDVTGLEGSKIRFTASETFTEPVSLSFFNETTVTPEEWAGMVDFSGAAGVMNFSTSVDADGKLWLTAGSSDALPEPASWLLLVLAGSALLRIRKSGKSST